MVARADVERFRSANAGLSTLVQDEMQGFFGALNLNKPEAARDALLEFTPLLTSQYGAGAATLAADWYDELRADAGSTGKFRAQVAESVPTGAVEAKVRYLAGHLWTPNPEKMLGGLLVATDKYVKQPGRDTIANNARREHVRWARIPSGSKTCSFCLMLASRDAVYLSERKAGGAGGTKYHGYCDCVPTRIESIDDYPEGYDPDELYRMYQIARDSAGSGDIADIAAAMRREFPNSVTDGIGTRSTAAAVADTVEVSAAAAATRSAEAVEVTDLPDAAAEAAVPTRADMFTVENTADWTDEDFMDLMGQSWDDPELMAKLESIIEAREARRDPIPNVAPLADEAPPNVPIDPFTGKPYGAAATAETKRRNLTKAESLEEAYRNYVDSAWLKAEDEMSGNFLNPEGKRKGIDAYQLFHGADFRTVRKYASEELIEFFEREGRHTKSSFDYMLNETPSAYDAFERVKRAGFAGSSYGGTNGRANR